MTLSNVIMIAMTTVITTVVGMLIRYVAGLTKAAKDTNETTVKAVRSVLKYDIVREHEFSVKRGYISRYVKATILEMHDRYKALGGNSFVDDLVEDIEDLPLEDVRPKQ